MKTSLMFSSATSKAAAKEIAPVAGTQRAMILDAIRLYGDYGLTDLGIREYCALSGDTVRPRRGELLKAGLIRDSGKTRKTASGRDAVVWVAASARCYFDEQGERDRIALRKKSV